MGCCCCRGRLQPAPPDTLRVSVHGEQWWWRIRYQPPDTPAFVLANEIRLPVGRPVEFLLESDNVIHSFWVPSLGGKMDLIPGRTNRLLLRPTRAGTFAGMCAEFCGRAHATMRLTVIVVPEDEFDRWMAAQASRVRRGHDTMTPDVDPLDQAPPLDVRQAQEARLHEAWNPPTGWRYCSEVNNSAVGMWYTALTVAFLVFGGVLALLMRIQLAVPGNTFLAPETYNQIFTLHGSVMMFLFAIPIFEAISILFLPQMLGARELPFPRLSAYGLLGVPDRRHVPVRLDLLRRGAQRRLVHVSAAHQPLRAGHRRRHVAARLLVHRGRGDCGLGGADRRRAEVPAARACGSI